MRTLIAVMACAMLSGCGLLKGGMPPAHLLSDPNRFAMLNTVHLDEVEAAELAKHQALFEEVRMCADRLMHDHAAMIQDLHQLAQRINMKPETPVLAALARKDHMEIMQDLRKRSGPDFDHAYVTSQIMMHEQTIQFIDETAESANNLLLREHMRNMHRDLEGHLSTVKVIKRHLVAQH